MKKIFAVVLASLLLFACSPLGQAIQQGQTLSPEQIAALDQAGQAVVGCLEANGPPGNGSIVLIVLPKSAAGSVQFDASCHPISDITLGK